MTWKGGEGHNLPDSLLACAAATVQSWSPPLMHDGPQGDGLLPPHGGYEKSRSFQVAQQVFEATLVFCDRFVDRRSRTHDQMVQAARSGSRNISEGSVVSGTSKKGELKLTNIARASLEELLRDYQDFLRHRNLPVWPKDSPQALEARQRYKSDRSDQSDWSDLKSTSPEVAANSILCLINQVSYLLRRQLQRLERDFLEKGGFTERLYASRTRARPADAPVCPRCGKPMRQRTARTGPHAGQVFWGCSAYPDCKGIRPFSQSD